MAVKVGVIHGIAKLKIKPDIRSLAVVHFSLHSLLGKEYFFWLDVEHRKLAVTPLAHVP